MNQNLPNEIIIATGNAGKVREFKEILTGFIVSSMGERGIHAEVEETGTTFRENAYLKAKALADELARRGICAIAVADDSGIEIDAFDKGPGVYSARFLGHDTPYEIKNKIILDRLRDTPVEERTARYVASVVAVLPDGQVLDGYGTVEGLIAWKPEGEGGFGYDPIFYVPEFGKSMACLTPDEKNSISHRGRALREFVRKLREEDNTD